PHLQPAGEYVGRQRELLCRELVGRVRERLGRWLLVLRVLRVVGIRFRDRFIRLLGCGLVPESVGLVVVVVPGARPAVCPQARPCPQAPAPRPASPSVRGLTPLPSTPTSPRPHAPNDGGHTCAGPSAPPPRRATGDADGPPASPWPRHWSWPRRSSAGETPTATTPGRAPTTHREA